MSSSYAGKLAVSSSYAGKLAASSSYPGWLAGRSLLDPFGGSGTIAIEAAVHVPRVTAFTSDNDRRTTSAAIRNIRQARASGLAAGSSIQARDWDATRLVEVATSSIDLVVADLPFGHRCRWDVEEEASRWFRTPHPAPPTAHRQPSALNLPHPPHPAPPTAHRQPSALALPDPPHPSPSAAHRQPSSLTLPQHSTFLEPS